MKRLNWRITLGVSLVLASAILYAIHYLVFRDLHHIFIYLLGDVAFLPIEVLLVTIVVHELLTAREKRVMLKKLNMVIGAFFSEVGTRLLRSFVAVDAAAAEKRAKCCGVEQWTSARVKDLAAYLGSCEYREEPAAADFERLRGVLVGKRDFLLALLENPNLLEHESFTEMLWAVFHLSEELEAREDFSKLPPSDIAHLKGDMKRAYRALALEWLLYMEHLKANYPYLYSLALRTNPFEPATSIVVTENPKT